MSFPDRGPWGDSKWRGNCSGHVYRELFEQLRPTTFVDPMAGSGTSIEVAREMGIEAWGLDIHHGFNALKDSILGVVGKEVDLCISHPPYGGMIAYTDHSDDLSRCKDDEDFHQKMQSVMLNQRDATRSGGYYGCLIGDWRREGKYTSYQAEIVARLPRDELAGIIIKTQHNCVSDTRVYTRMTLPRIAHEYLLLFKKSARPVLVLLSGIAKEQQARLTGTWKNIVRQVLMQLGGQASLDRIYAAVSNSAPEKLASNPHWKDKVRQMLNTNAEIFGSSSRGVWALG